MDQSNPEKVSLSGVQKSNFDEINKNIDEIKQWGTLFTNEDKAKQYDARAEKYDYILQNAIGYGDPDVMAKAVAELNLPKDTKFMDFGAGTGLVGDSLHKSGGYTNFDGIDASSQMLVKAKEKGLYKETEAMFLGNGPLPEKWVGKYDCLVCAGSLVPGHIPPTTGFD